MNSKQRQQFLLATRCLVAAAVTWLPLFILTLQSGQATGDASTRPLLVDLSVDARFLIALPLMIVADAFIGSRLQAVIDYLSASDMLVGQDRDCFDTAAAAYNRLYGSRIAFIGTAVFTVVASLLTLMALVKSGNMSWFADGSGHYRGVSAAGWWHIAVSMTLWHYVLLRRFWQFVLWAVFLIRLSRLDLKLVPTHPDCCGGIGILEMGQLSFTMLGTGASVILSASLAESLIAGSITSQAAIPYLVVFVLMCILVVLSPLLGFVPVLAQAKRNGLVTYGDLGEGLFRAFGTRWAGLSSEEQCKLLGDTDPSSLADYGYAYEVVASMRIQPISRNGFMTIAVAALVPFLPLVFISNSVTEIVVRLLGVGG